MPFGTTGQDGRRIVVLIVACWSVLAAFLLFAAPAEAATRVKVLGRAVEGQTLTIAPRTAAKGSTFTWWRCRPATRCTRIPRATSSRIRVNATHIGFRLRLDVRSGRRVTKSPLTAVVRPRPPVLVAAPSIAGDVAVGHTLSSSAGSWAAGGRAVATRRQWLRCTATCTPVAGATGATHALGVLDIGASLRLAVTASVTVRGVTSTSRAQSASTAPVRLDLTNTGAPTIGGAATEGATLTATSGDWQASGVPVSTSIRWVRCASSCVAVGDGATYRLSAVDVGARLRVDISAVAASVTGSASSASTGVVAAVAPTNLAAPTIIAPSPLLVGSVASADLGSWSSLDPTTYARQWQRCGAAGCVDIVGATGATYVPTAADLASSLRMRVVAFHLGLETAVASATTALVAGVPPRSTSVPTLSGTAIEGATLTRTVGSFTGTGSIDVARSWVRCTDGACVQVAGDTATLVLGAADVGSTIKYVEDATSVWGSTSHASAATAPVLSAAPANVTVAVVTSSMLRDTGTATTTNGAWTGIAPIAYSYQWERCAAQDALCTTIEGATGSTYAITTVDVGLRLRSRVTATNAYGIASVTSPTTAVVDVTPQPVNTTLPTITGAPIDGTTLAVGQGTWSGYPVLSRGYQWRRCNADGANCTNIFNATTTTYRIASADVGFTVRVRETVLNSVGNASVESAATPVVWPAAPASTSLPTIIGLAKDGQVLKASTGGWSGTTPISYAYAWLRCDIAGENCEAVPGADGTSYLAKTDDVGTRIRLRVTATNGAGSASAMSVATGTVAATPPVNVTSPAISGTAAVNATLSVSTGTWTGLGPIAITYAWFRCGSTSCGTTALTTSATYQATAADQNMRLKVVVTAANVAGSSTVTLFSPVIAAAIVPPSVLTVPTITGDAKEGLTLSASLATFAGTPTITHSLSWERCQPDLNGCEEIVDATSNTYRLTAADVGRVIKVIDTGTNLEGAVNAESAPTPVVIDTFQPTSDPADPPLLDGALWEHGQKITIDRGTWTGTPTITFTYQWTRCELDGNDCVDIDAATAVSYYLRAEDVGHRIRVRVTGTSPYGTSDAFSDTSSEVAAARAPVNSGSLPGVSGTLEQTRTVTALNGTWTGSPIDRYEYQWQRCNMFGQSCAPITGGTSRTYMLALEDVGATMRVRVTAFNTAAPDGVAALSPASGIVIAATPPTEVTPPLIGGGWGKVEVITNTGTWKGTATITVKYQWQRCALEDESTCANIGALGGKSYAPAPADVGYFIRAIGYASNGAVTTPVQSTPSNYVGPIVDGSGGGTPPVNVVRPVIVGANTIVGTRIEAREDEWIGSQLMTETVTWQRCDPDNVCANVAGASGRFYLLTNADLGSRVRAVVKMTNAYGVGFADTDPVDVLPATAPIPPASLPAITNSTSSTDPLVAGHNLRATPGTWGGTPTIRFTYTWSRCTAVGDGCVLIEGAAAATYVTTMADVGSTLRATVTATNPAEVPVSAVTGPTSVVGTPVQPGIVELPTVDDSPERTATVESTQGTWLGSKPIVLTQIWQRCTTRSVDSCTDITAATETKYVPNDLDVGRYLRVVVTATNGLGPAGAQTVASPMSANAVTGGSAPTSVEAPVVNGPALVGSAHTTDPGLWLGTARITFSYQWQRCTSADAVDCVDIVGRTSSGYTPVEADRGAWIRVLVQGHNGVGVSQWVASATRGPIA